MLRPLDIAMGLAVPLIWGMGVVFAKAAIEHFPPILLMSLRFTLTALVLVWFVRPPLGKLGAIFMATLVSAAIQYSLTFNGLRGVDASTAVLVIQLEVPFLVLLGALLLGERPGWRKWFGIAIAFLGVGFIAGEPKLGSATTSLVLVISGAFVWAVGQIMVRRLVNLDGHPGTFPPDHQPVVMSESKIRIARVAGGGEQDQAPGVAGGAVSIPTRPYGPVEPVQIVHPGAFHAPIVQQESAGLDNIQRHAEAGRQPHQRSGVLRDVRLVEDEAHGLRTVPVGLNAEAKPVCRLARRRLPMYIDSATGAVRYPEPRLTTCRRETGLVAPIRAILRTDRD